MTMGGGGGSVIRIAYTKITMYAMKVLSNSAISYSFVNLSSLLDILNYNGGFA